jgi:hypothetical protein
MGGRHNAFTRAQTFLIPVMPHDGIRVIAYSASRRIPEQGSTRPHGSDDSHVSVDLLDHRIQPSAQHLLGETESEPLDRVEW